MDPVHPLAPIISVPLLRYVDRVKDHYTGVGDIKEFHTEPARVGVSDPAVSGDKLPSKAVSHRSFSDRISGTTVSGQDVGSRPHGRILLPKRASLCGDRDLPSYFV